MNYHSHVTRKFSIGVASLGLFAALVAGCAGGSLTTREKGAGIGALGGAAAGEDADHLLVHVALRVERAARWDLGNVAAGDALHTMQMNKRRFTAGSGTGSDFKRAQISHAVANMYR